MVAEGHYNIYFDICAVILTVIFIFFYTMQGSSFEKKERVILWLMSMLGVTAAAEAVFIGMLNKNRIAFIQPVASFARMLALGCHNVVPYLLAVYIAYFVGAYRRYSEKKHRLFAAPMAAAIALLLIPPTRQLIYRIEPDGVYTTGWLYIYLFVQTFFYMVSCIYFIFAYRKEIGRRGFHAAVISQVLTVATIFVDLIIPQYKTTNFFQLVVCVGVVITFELKNKSLQAMSYSEAMEQAYAEAKRANIAKTDFLSRMSHDIRTPINGIVGMTHIMEKEMKNEEKVRDSLNNIKILTGQLEMLINDVLEMSRIESGRMHLSHEAFDLCARIEVLRPAIQVLADGRGVYLEETQYELTHSVVVSSPIHMQRVISNILTNAVKYNRSGGTVECRVSERPVDDGHSSYELKIRDTGIGMSQEFLAHIFEPFSRERETPDTTYSGTGLGMAITGELVHMMGGTIHIESEPDVGTTVTVQLPLEIAKELPQEDEAQTMESLAGKRILLVEDNKMNLKIAKYLLEEEHALVDTAQNGREAVERFTAGQPGTYHLILMDVQMPVMNGLEATQTIRGMERPDAQTIPILAMTANAFQEDVLRCKEAGMNEHIAKPLDIERAMGMIARYIRENAQEMENC
ncbi:MAG: ATP-binding protein [Eubacteriales bacterium]|nr:ATP-binding protein [Eubacteriales bacterium]